jgi:hypothetical protein
MFFKLISDRLNADNGLNAEYIRERFETLINGRHYMKIDRIDHDTIIVLFSEKITKDFIYSILWPVTLEENKEKYMEKLEEVKGILNCEFFTVKDGVLRVCFKRNQNVL